MNQWIRNLLIPALTLTVAAPAMAHAGTDRVYDRIHRQEARIERGIDTGELTRREARELRHELGETRDLARRFRYHGFSPRESRILDRRLDHSRRLIKRLTSNDATSYRRSHYDRHDRSGYRDGRNR